MLTWLAVGVNCWPFGATTTSWQSDGGMVVGSSTATAERGVPRGGLSWRTPATSNHDANTRTAPMDTTNVSAVKNSGPVKRMMVPGVPCGPTTGENDPMAGSGYSVNGMESTEYRSGDVSGVSTLNRT